MTQIIQSYSSVRKYTDDVNHNPQLLQPNSCCECGCEHFWRNGVYPRKIAGRDRYKTICDPIDIIRFRCSRCKHDYSIMPSPIALYRWYFWCFQLQVLLSVLQGASLNATANTYAISRDTVSRWYYWLLYGYKQFQLSICANYPQFAAFSDQDVILFYQELFEWRELSALAQYWHDDGLLVPYQWRRANE